MNKGELIKEISERGDMTRAEAGRALDLVIANMVGAMKDGGRVMITGFGSFRVIERDSQKGRNPQTGKPMVIPAGRL